MTYRKIGLIALVLAAVLVAALLCIKFVKPAAAWPPFPPSQENEPQVVVQVEPDFGYRTGDLVLVDLFVKQMPGTKVDISSMAFEGNFEIHGESKITEYQLPDGVKIYRIKLVLQSFAVQRKLNASMSMIWEVEGDPETKEIRQPLLEVFTSYTWDGREQIKDGLLALRKGYHWQISLLILLFSVGGLIWTFRALNRAYKAQQEHGKHQISSQATLCKRRVDAALERIGSGDHAACHYQEIDAALREYLGLENRLLKEIPKSLSQPAHILYENQIMRSLISCEKVIFGKLSLSEAEIAGLRKDPDDLLLGRYSFSLMNQDPGYILPGSAVDPPPEEEVPEIPELPGPWDDEPTELNDPDASDKENKE